MKNSLWIVPVVGLALWSTPAFVAAQLVPPPPTDQPATAPAAPSSVPPEQPTAAPPAAEPAPAQPPPAAPTFPGADETTYTGSAESAPDLSAASASLGAPEEDTSPFGRGRSSLSLLVGSSWGGDRTYLILGAEYGYFLIKGLEVGAGATFYLFDSPFMLTLSPFVTYVFDFIKTVKPYVGVFYRHYIVTEGFDDRDSLGARVGAYIAPDRARWYFGVGVAYEHLLDCNEDVWECDDWYPELVVAIAF
ncbi:MAG TPA: hypothetical protein VJV78_36510 [Polyangiales bacterium]|nr:hypothetical protein [Polyangiales bacterium]